MKHLSEEGLVEHYFGNPGSRSFRIAQRHLEGCSECAADGERLAADLKVMQEMDCEEAGVDYGESVWNRLASKLPPLAAPAARARRLTWGWGLGYAAVCGVLVLAAFQIGRVWEHRQQPRIAIAKAPAHGPAARQVVVVVLDDHLDRTERLLVELKHADGEDAELMNPLREEARSLLAANHVFREDADKSGDAALKKALDHLDRLLTDVANEPGGLNRASIGRLQKEMTADGLLFEVRVLRSRNPHREMMARVAAKGGTA
jgi:hypothetical protein